MSQKKKRPTKGKKKRSDISPFLDYFSMLSEYLDKGYLQIDVAKHEVYVTQPAIHALSPGNDPAEQLRNGAIARTAPRLRAWAALMSGEGNDYMKRNSSVHVVKDEEPHDLMYTILLSKGGRLFGAKTKVQLITYPKK